jgi:hypothetical protein
MAVLDGCDSGIGIGRRECLLTLDFEGVTRTWTYSENYPQFAGMPPGSLVPVLVDPAHPDVADTVADVRARTNAGWTGPGLLGAVFLVSGMTGSAFGIALVLSRPRSKLMRVLGSQRVGGAAEDTRTLGE